MVVFCLVVEVLSTTNDLVSLSSADVVMPYVQGGAVCRSVLRDATEGDTSRTGATPASSLLHPAVVCEP